MARSGNACRALIYTLFVVVSVINMTGHAQPVLVDKIVAVVDDYPLLHSEVEDKLSAGPLVILTDFPADNMTSRRRRAINDLINLQLVREALAERDVEVSDRQVERRIDDFLASRNLNRADLKDFLQAQGKSYRQYQQDFRTQMMVDLFYRSLIVPQIKITTADVYTYYLKKSGRTGDLTTVDLRQILISTDKQQADQLYRQLQQGLAFGKAIERYHDSRVTSDMPKILLKDLAPELRVEVESLDVGSFSKPIKTALGYHLFQVVAKQQHTDEKFLAGKDQLELELKNQELARQTRLWLAKRHQQINITLTP